MRYLLIAAAIFLLPLLSLAQGGQTINPFGTTGDNEVSPVALQRPEPDIFPKVEVMPEFPGGSKALAQFLGRNIRYPQNAIDNGTEGKLIVKFVVCEDGSLCNEEFQNRLGDGCEQEVLRVLRLMPPWKPGLVDGKPVKTFFRLPVTFKFDEPIEEPVQPKQNVQE